jgi:type IV secretory pathway TraG/TraD family ATPase VirD4
MSRLAEELGTDLAGGDRIALGFGADGLIRAEPLQPVLVLGAPRTGKTTGFVTPALLEWQGPAVVTSIRRDVVDATIDTRRRLGKVQVFEPTGQLGADLPRVGFDPVACATTWDRAFSMVHLMVHMALSDAAKPDPFWYHESEKLLAPLLLAANAVGGSMRDVLQWLQREDHQTVVGVLEELSPVALDSYLSYRSIYEAASVTGGGIKATAASILTAYQSEAVLGSLSAELFDPEQFLDGESNTLYLCAPPNTQSELAPLITALVRDLIATVYEREAQSRKLDPALLLCLDEAGNVCRVPDLDRLATTAAGSGMQLVTVFHNMNQAISAYGREMASTILVNHGVMVVFPGLRESDTYQMLDGVITADELPPGMTGQPSSLLRRLQPDEVLCIYRHLPPETLVVRRNFDDPDLMGLVMRGATGG